MFRVQLNSKIFLLRRDQFARSFSSAKVSPASQVVVQKFGGTSLGTPEKLEKVIGIIEKFHSREQNVVAVVSAFSSETKQEGTTTRLLNAADAAVTGGDYANYLDKIAETHLTIINAMLATVSIKDDTSRFVESELERVKQFCSSLSVIQELSPRSHDLIIGCGERLASGVLSGVLRENGLDAVMLDLSKAFPKGLDTTQRNYINTAKQTFKPLLTPLLNKGMIPVVTGYFGQINGGIIGAVGRGYTDLTAAICAASLGANQLQVWKESDGVFTGNPTKIEKAKLLHNVTPSEASELTYFGNEVLHPFTMACAINDKVPIAILNTFKPDGMGTVISPDWSKNPDILKSRPGKSGVVAVCSKSKVSVLNLVNGGALESHEYFAKVFSCFQANKVKADLISTSMNKLTVTLHESTSDAKKTKIVEQLAPFGDCEIEDNKAIVSCIGQGMKSQRGLAAQVFKSLSDGGVNIEMISQGASEINISVVINAEDQNKAIHCIHETFLE